ncbi:MAG: hypothetical protein HQL04_02785, partial [Nitrospirae bacterium]|nr:hypothetical protein [Nitrospirota bacterium]
PHEDEFKSEGPKEEYIPEGEIEFAIEQEQWEDPTLVLNTGNVGIIKRVLDEKPVADPGMDGDFEAEITELSELIIDNDQMEIEGLDLDNPPGASKDITVVYGSGTARQSATDEAEIEPPVDFDVDLDGDIEIDFDMQEDLGAVDDITLDYSGIDLSAPEVGGPEIEPEIEPAMELNLQEGQPQEAEDLETEELSGELDIDLEIEGDEGVALEIDDTGSDGGGMETEGVQADMGLEIDAGDLAIDADSELVLDKGELEIDGVEGEEALLGAMDIEFDESEAPTYTSDYVSEKTDDLQPESVTEGVDELDDAEVPTMLAGNKSELDVCQLAVEHESIELEHDDDIDYAEGLRIEIGGDDLDVELKYDAGLSLGSDDLDAALKYEPVQSFGDEEKTAVFGQKIQPGKDADDIDVRPQSDHYSDALSLDDYKEGEVYDLSDDEGLDIVDDDDFSFSSIESLPGDLNEFKQFQTEGSGLCTEDAGLDLDIDDKLDKTLQMDIPLNDKEPTGDNKDDDTIKIKNS